MPATLTPTFFACLVLGGALAGCIGGPEGGSGPAAGDLASLAYPSEPIATGSGAYDELYAFAMAHPYRFGDHPTHEASRAYLRKALASYGLDVQDHPYDRGVNVLGLKHGTTRPDEWIVLSAHYDTTETTVFGAWDDGAGTAALLEMARAYAAVPWERTIVFAFFDGEEQGLEGSRAFVRDHMARENVALQANVNFDPPGLNWPCENPDGSKLALTIVRDDSASAANEALVAAVVDGAARAGVPGESVEVYSGGIAVATLNGQGAEGGSDHESFQRAGVPGIFVGGDVNLFVGPVGAMTYALHTPLDTAPQMEARCGGVDLLKGAFQAVLDLTQYALERLDRAPLLDLGAEDA